MHAQIHWVIQVGRDLRTYPVQFSAQSRVSCGVRQACSGLLSSWVSISKNADCTASLAQPASLPGCLKGERLILTPSLNTPFFNLWQLSVVFSLGTWIKTLPTLSHSESQPCLQCLSAFTVRLKNICSEHEMLRVTYFVMSLREQNSSWIFLLFGHFSFNLIRTLLKIKHWLFQIITLNFTAQYCIFFTHILLCVCPSLPYSKQPV